MKTKSNDTQACLEYIEHLRRNGYSPIGAMSLLENSDFSSRAIKAAIARARKLVMWTIYPTCMGIPSEQVPMWE